MFRLPASATPPLICPFSERLPSHESRETRSSHGDLEKNFKAGGSAAKCLIRRKLVEHSISSEQEFPGNNSEHSMCRSEGENGALRSQEGRAIGQPALGKYDHVQKVRHYPLQF